jgi:hypothetical protein
MFLFFLPTDFYVADWARFAPIQDSLPTGLKPAQRRTAGRAMHDGITARQPAIIPTASTTCTNG